MRRCCYETFLFTDFLSNFIRIPGRHRKSKARAKAMDRLIIAPMLELIRNPDNRNKPNPTTKMIDVNSKACPTSSWWLGMP